MTIKNKRLFLSLMLAIVGVCAIISTITTKAAVDKEGLITKKTASYNNGAIQYRIESHVTGAVTTVRKSVPLDIVLVLDQSGSMQNAIDPTQSREKALVDSVNRFLNRVYDDSVEQKVDHRVSIVGFTGIGQDRRYRGVEILSQPDDKRVQFHPLDNREPMRKKYADSLMSITTQFGHLSHAINENYRSGGGTNQQLGLIMAEKVFENARPHGDVPREKVVVLFTDGEPADNDFTVNELADYGIDVAYRLKNNKTKLYTVGLTDKVSLYDLDYRGTGWARFNINRFLHFMSSNFDNVWNYAGTQTETLPPTNYYLPARSADELEEAFTSITTDIGKSHVNLDESAILLDEVPAFLEVKHDTVRVMTSAYLGADTWDQPVDFAATIVPSELGVAVSGFDYATNFVSDAPKARGKKLILEFEATVKPGFMGGNQIETNLPSSGMYESLGEPMIEGFEIPTVDIPIQFDFGVHDQATYQTVGVNLKDIIDLENSLASGHYPIAGNNDYVDITIQVRNSFQNTVGSITIPHGQAVDENLLGWFDAWKSENLTLDMTVTPIHGGHESAKKQQKDVQIAVYNPNVVLQDKTRYLGQSYTVPSFENTTWHVDNPAYANVGVLDKALKPDVLLNYKPLFNYDETLVTPGQSYFPKHANTFNVSAHIGNHDISSFTTFVNTSATTQEAKYQPQFHLNLKTANLTINKTIEGQQSHKDQAFVFNVRWLPNQAQSQAGFEAYEYDVVLKKDGSQVIEGLPVGTYVVKEDTSWSWSYEQVSKPKNNRVQLSPSKPNGQASFVNKQTNTNWLTSEARVTNEFDTSAGGR